LLPSATKIVLTYNPAVSINNGFHMSRNRFLPGNNGHGGGRPLGSRNKLQGDFLKALAADFAEHGAGVIKIARIEKPIEYLKVIASVLRRRSWSSKACLPISRTKNWQATSRFCSVFRRANWLIKTKGSSTDGHCCRRPSFAQARPIDEAAAGGTGAPHE
jgi:hypothetical protein